jgi:hypothetical protein
MSEATIYGTPLNLEKLAREFDEQWYLTTYAADLEELKQPGETALEFYLRLGGRLGHDPHATFSELYFRTLNPEVYQHLLATPAEFGFLVFLGGFGEEFPDLKTPTPAQSEHWRTLALAVDQRYLAETQEIDPSQYISPLDFYIQASLEAPISPSPDFSEHFYRATYPEVESNILKGNLISGYHHFVTCGLREGRRAISVGEFQRRLNVAQERERAFPGALEDARQLERQIPGISAALELGYITALEFLLEPVVINRRDGQEKGFLVFIPYYFPEIFFAGYLAFFKFLKSIKRLQRCDMKLVIVQKGGMKEQMERNLKRIGESFPDIAELFSSYHLLQEGRTIDVDGDYGVISYCAETHFVASDAARQMNITPVFFVQDYEPDFHGDGTLKTFARSAFELPHVGVYNSRKLYEYFRDQSGIGQTSSRRYQHATFENPIKPMPWDWEEFRARHAAKDKRRLIVYARPEVLGARNEFGIVVLALKQALRDGHLDAADWIFRGVGSMTAHLPIPLGNDAQLEMVPKLPLRDYEDMLLLGDIGISLISTPHPGIIHFQMASFGLATVTYATKGRSAEWLQAQSKNIVPSPVTIQGISDALARAAELATDLSARHHNAVRSVVHTDERDLDAAAEFVLRQKTPAR